MKYWEIIAVSLSKAGWSLGWVSAVDSEGRTIFVVDAHRGDGKRFVVRADEKLSRECATPTPDPYRRGFNSEQENSEEAANQWDRGLGEEKPQPVLVDERPFMGRTPGGKRPRLRQIRPMPPRFVQPNQEPRLVPSVLFLSDQTNYGQP